MTQIAVSILGKEVSVSCAAADTQRVQDLAKSLDQRLVALAESAPDDAVALLTRAALGLMAENQASGAALARAHYEIERLNDLALETEPSPWPRRPVLAARRA
ncbi:MAG: cell division protein ZapA [Caulobacterales bacterium]